MDLGQGEGRWRSGSGRRRIRQAAAGQLQPPAGIPRPAGWWPGWPCGAAPGGGRALLPATPVCFRPAGRAGGVVFGDGGESWTASTRLPSAAPPAACWRARRPARGRARPPAGRSSCGRCSRAPRSPAPGGRRGPRRAACGSGNAAALRVAARWRVARRRASELRLRSVRRGSEADSEAEAGGAAGRGRFAGAFDHRFRDLPGGRDTPGSRGSGLRSALFRRSSWPSR